jgi:hypothetical protein
MVYVVMKQSKLYDIITISNMNEWNTYITEALRRGGSFTMLLRLHTKAAATEVVIVDEEEQPE